MVKNLLLACAILLLAGCKGSPSLVGKWSSQSDASGITITTITEHKADGTFTSTSTGASSSATTLNVAEHGTWKAEGEKLKLTYADITWSFSGGKLELVKRANERFKSNKSNIIAEANRIGAVTVVWSGNDEFSATVDGKKYTYRRVK